MSARPYKIEAQPLVQRYARGWHCLGLASEYKDGKPHTLNIFGSGLLRSWIRRAALTWSTVIARTWAPI